MHKTSTGVHNGISCLACHPNRMTQTCASCCIAQFHECAWFNQHFLCGSELGCLLYSTFDQFWFWGNVITSSTYPYVYWITHWLTWATIRHSASVMNESFCLYPILSLLVRTKLSISILALDLIFHFVVAFLVRESKFGLLHIIAMILGFIGIFFLSTLIQTPCKKFSQVSWVGSTLVETGLVVKPFGSIDWLTSLMDLLPVSVGWRLPLVLTNHVAPPLLAPSVTFDFFWGATQSFITWPYQTQFVQSIWMLSYCTWCQTLLIHTCSTTNFVKSTSTHMWTNLPHATFDVC